MIVGVGLAQLRLCRSSFDRQRLLIRFLLLHLFSTLSGNHILRFLALYLFRLRSTRPRFLPFNPLGLHAFLDHSLRPLFNFLLQNDWVLFHYVLNGQSRGQQVSKAGHPHASVVLGLRAQVVEPVRCLQVEWVWEVLGRCSVFLGDVNVENVSEHYEFEAVGIFAVLRGQNGHHGSLVVNHEVPLRRHLNLKQFNLIHILP